MRTWTGAPGILLLTTTALAADGGMKPGMYEYSIKMEMPGMPFAMPPQTFQRCLTQADVDKGELARNPQDPSECQISNMKHGPNKVTYDVACAGDPPTKGHYEFTTTATSMNGTGTMDMGGQSMKQTFAARRLGDCK